MFEQKKQRERIFDGIFEQFAKGKKLHKYNEYKLMENMIKSKRDIEKAEEAKTTKRVTKKPIKYLDNLRESVERNLSKRN